MLVLSTAKRRKITGALELVSWKGAAGRKTLLMSDGAVVAIWLKRTIFFTELATTAKVSGAAQYCANSHWRN